MSPPRPMLYRVFWGARLHDLKRYVEGKERGRLLHAHLRGGDGIDLVSNERLVTDWLDWRGDQTRPLTRVAWLLESVGAKTRVTIIHGGFSRAADQSDYPFGWRSFLERLKSEAEAHS